MKLIPTSVNPVTITLYQGIPFDNNYSEHTLLSTKFKFQKYISATTYNVGSEKESFINMKNSQNQYIYPRTTKTGTYNFAFGNGLVTSVVMELTDNEINSNYMKVVSGSDSYYYFITGLTQKNEVTYLLNLELDVMMTYGDDFLDNVANKPVMVERKHCRRIIRTRRPTSPYTQRTYINPICFNQESTFSKLKANVIKEFTPLEFKDFINGANNFNELMAELNWIYIIVGKSGGDSQITIVSQFKENDIEYPFEIVCVPTKILSLKNIDGNGKDLFIDPRSELNYFVGNPSVQKIIISPFPPFKLCSNIVLSFDSTLKVYELNVTTYTYTLLNNLCMFTTGTNSTGSEIVGVLREDAQIYPHGYLVVSRGYGGAFEYTTKTGYFNVDIPAITNGRDVGEYKLQIAPFKDLRMSSYYGGENHIHTQYLFLKDYVADSGTYDIKPFTIASSNAEVNSYFDFVNLGNYDIEAKRGISSSVAYNFPTGTDAELLYNQTQKNQYENSKTISVINNGLKIIGGGLAVAFAPSPMGKIAGGVSLVSGVTGEIETFTSYNAKMEDLKNTPNSYNFSGSSLGYDMAIANEGGGNLSLLPYLITYGVTYIEQQMGGEFIYNYGYEYNAESYFNTTLSHGGDGIFTRQLFNYVKIREDITSKIVGSNLPLIVAQKFNEIFNAGIKLWNFFNFNFSNPLTVSSILLDYFQQTDRCNAELVEENMLI